MRRWRIRLSAVRGLLVGLVTAVTMMSPVAARAQFGLVGGLGAGMGDMTEAAVSRKGMSNYCDLLEMGPAERELALELHAGYLDNFKQTTDVFQQRMERLQREFQDTRDFAVFQEQMPPIAKAFIKRMKELEDGIFADLRTLADVTQTDERWIRVERMRRREQARQGTMISGDAVDLVAIVAEHGGDDPPPAVQEALLRYEVELDSVLAERQRMFEDAMDTMLDVSFDPEEQAKMMEFWEDFMTKAQDLGRRAKGINARYAAEVQRLLPEANRAAFDHEVKRRTWPTVYRESYPQRLLDAAEGMSDLTERQREVLGQIEREYTASAEAINARWASLIDEREEEASGLMGSFVFGMDDESEEAKAKAERRELDKRTQMRIREALTEAQQERLPEQYELDDDLELPGSGGG